MSVSHVEVLAHIAQGFPPSSLLFISKWYVYSGHKSLHGGVSFAVTRLEFIVERLLTPIRAVARFIHIHKVINLHVALIQVQDCDGLDVEGLTSPLKLLKITS
jgi:hypothetical protein